MSESETASPGEAKSTLNFHPDFATPIPNSIILQADDRQALCFYARLSLFTALSSFFGDLPPPSPSDYVNGAPFLFLPETSSAGLAVFIAAIHSTTEEKPFHIDYSPYYDRTKGIVDAAVMARRYDTPIIYRLLAEHVRPSVDSGSGHRLLLYAIWAIGGVRTEMAMVAKASQPDDTREATADTFAALEAHAPGSLAQLKGLHTRRVTGVTLIRGLEDDLTCRRCLANGTAWGQTASIIFHDADTVEKIMAKDDDNYLPLDCEDCVKKVRRVLDPSLCWLERYTSELDFDMSHEEYYANESPDGESSDEESDEPSEEE